jgi:hypothetical protein
MGWLDAVSALLAPYNKVAGSKVQQADWRDPRAQFTNPRQRFSALPGSDAELLENLQPRLFCFS